jgi:replicative DNA helicase
MRIESLILSNLIQNEDYCRKVVPYIDKSYFTDRKESVISSIISKFFDTYNKPISHDILEIEISNYPGISDKEVSEFSDYSKSLTVTESNTEWLLEKTEKFCKDRAVYNAILNSIKIIEGKDSKNTQDAIPSILTQALSITFDNHVGHDYFEDAETRYDYYNRVEERIGFNLDFFNKITKGGLPKKTLNIALAGTGVGKSLFMCHVAAGNLIEGRNVLYITMEMAEERIAERIDANILNISMDKLGSMSKEVFLSRIKKVTEKTNGKLIVKEYPTSSAHAGHFRALLEELKVKRNFTPDIVMIDYLNICSSQRVKMSGGVNSYTYIKAIAEELRGLAVEYNVPIISATQTTRSGFTNSDPGLEDTSESFGLPATADFMFALVSNEQLESMGQIMVKQLKNRYASVDNYKRFIIGIDRSKMTLYDVEDSAQDDLSGVGNTAPWEADPAAFSKTDIGGERSAGGFSDFKF